MTTTIALPGYIPAFQKVESTPARAMTFATNLRAVTVGVKDVQEWAAGNADPDWSGDTAETHDHAATRFARRLDGAEAALDRAVTAADLFHDQLTELVQGRTTIETERQAVNTAVVDLRAEINAATDESRLPEFQQRAERLTTRATNVADEITTWTTRYDGAESDFIKALQAVDTVDEGQNAADDPGRPDVDALTDRFNRLKGNPEALHAWWLGLTRRQRQALTTEHPHLVGNTDGIPARDRDEGNRAALYSDLDYLNQRKEDGQLTRKEKGILENAEHVREAINDHREKLDLETGRELLHLLGFKPGDHSGDGGVIFSFGDPDTADHVSVNVPGLTSETSSTGGNLDKTWDLHEAALGEGRGTVASIYWLDYDAPSGNPVNPLDPLGQLDFGGVAFTAKAEAGGEQLSDFIDGLRASDEGERAHLTGIGHSYGSTTLGHALVDGADVDDAVILGSPGQPVSSADALTDADVWIGAKDNDPVTLLGRGERGGVGVLGFDPADNDFGGTRIETGDGSLRIQDLLKNHKSYFEGTSLDNMAHIITDNDGAVTEQPHRGEPGGEYLTLPELIGASSGASGGEWIYERGKDVVDFVGGIGDGLLAPFRLRG